MGVEDPFVHSAAVRRAEDNLFHSVEKMPLLLKNASIADMMLNRGIYAGYDPQDITAKIDDMIYSGTASSLKLNNVQSSVTLLISTGAVQEQDFIKWREQYYGKEIMPQLPFFYE